MTGLAIYYDGSGWGSAGHASGEGWSLVYSITAPDLLVIFWPAAFFVVGDKQTAVGPK